MGKVGQPLTSENRSDQKHSSAFIRLDLTRRLLSTNVQKHRIETLLPFQSQFFLKTLTFLSM